MYMNHTLRRLLLLLPSFMAPYQIPFSILRSHRCLLLKPLWSWPVSHLLQVSSIRHLDLGLQKPIPTHPRPSQPIRGEPQPSGPMSLRSKKSSERHPRIFTGIRHHLRHKVLRLRPDLCGSPSFKDTRMEPEPGSASTS